MVSPDGSNTSGSVFFVIVFSSWVSLALHVKDIPLSDRGQGLLKIFFEIGHINNNSLSWLTKHPQVIRLHTQFTSVFNSKCVCSLN